MHKYTILGLARSGIAAAYKLKELGYSPFLSEYQPADKIAKANQISQDFACEFGGHTVAALDCATMIVSPGIPDIPILQAAKDQGIELISEIELGFRLKATDSKIIAVTGSNGKSTTVSLINYILQTAGYQTILAGNIGAAFTSFPIQNQGIDFIVLELSSFQLELIKDFRADAAILLNITPDHLDRYASFTEYAATKFKIFQKQKSDDLAIINLDDPEIAKLTSQIRARKATFGRHPQADIRADASKIISSNANYKIADLSLQGPHNIANCQAAILLAEHLQIPAETIRTALKKFSALPHRLEFVATINGIDFVNDSKATNTDSVKFALQSFSQPLRLIMGGRGKGEDYSILNPFLEKYVSKLYLIGEAAAEMAETYTQSCPLQKFNSLEAAVLAAFQEAKKGETVLLSPACTSYDMYKNFEARGNSFKQIVRKLQA
ncbi:MAG: UDP-N-acetylmuramoyl-L-alanine--D-glutamate ligase [Candidatus Cloacimonadales bacterium]